MGEIYIIKNKISSKVYIGQTTQGSEVRFKQHLKLLKSNSTQIIHKAIKKYGKENFYFEVLEDNIPLDLLNEKEEYYIALYDCFHNGYNLCEGGNQPRRQPKVDLSLCEEDIIKLYNGGDGLSLRKIGLKFDVDKKRISQLLKKNNINVVKKNKSSNNLLESDKIIISELYKQGKTTSEIKELCFNNYNSFTITKYRKYIA